MLSNMNIGTRLVVSYLIMALIVCVTGVLAITYVSSVGAEGVSIGEEQAPLSDAAMEVKLNAAEAHLKFEEIISGDETENIDEEVYRRLDRSIWYCNAIMSGGRNEEGTFIATTNPIVHAKAAQVKVALEHFKATARERYAKRGQAVGPGSDADVAFDREFDEFVKMADDAEETIHKDMKANLDSLRSYSKKAEISMTVSMVVGVALALIVGLVMARTITRPMVRVAELSERIANGDLSIALDSSADEINGKNEVAVLKNAFRRMAGRLRELVGQLQSGISQLSTSTTEIASTAKESAASAAQQSVTVTEVSATMEEIQNTSQAAAKSAQEVVSSAERVAASGQDGLKAVDRAAVIMGAIEERVREIAERILQLSEQNKQIGEIVETVNDLSEQSNLLAVNASIEAAKAGEQGRGFAVVASEVRTLAEQSKRATQQIRSILGDIQKATQTAVMSTEEGTKRAKDGLGAIKSVRDTITDLARTLEDSADRVRQIAGNAAQQASGIQQISKAVTDLARSGRESAAGAGNLERAASDIRLLSDQLRTVSAGYRL
jgi:methyl-accepting chemotaxis protein